VQAFSRTCGRALRKLHRSADDREKQRIIFSARQDRLISRQPFIKVSFKQEGQS
jgi:hypothetical protein